MHSAYCFTINHQPNRSEFHWNIIFRIENEYRSAIQICNRLFVRSFSSIGSLNSIKLLNIISFSAEKEDENTKTNSPYEMVIGNWDTRFLSEYITFSGSFTCCTVYSLSFCCAFCLRFVIVSCCYCPLFVRHALCYQADTQRCARTLHIQEVSWDRLSN